jgi:hypothetical protein
MRICSRAGARSCIAASPKFCATSSQPDTAEPELLAHHFTQAGLTEAAIEWWGKAGQQSLERSALVEAIEQITRALDQVATLPATPALRREQIKLQVALISPYMHVRGYAAPETKAATEKAKFLSMKPKNSASMWTIRCCCLRSSTALRLPITCE